MRAMVGVFWIAALLPVAGCSEFGDIEAGIVEAITVTAPETQDRSNLVISCENGARWPAKWQVMWEGSGSLEPTTFAAQLEPGQSQNLVLTGPVFRFRPGQLEGAGPAAVIRPARDKPLQVTYDGPALELGVDYRMGDIITCRIAETAADDKYELKVEVAGGV